MKMNQRRVFVTPGQQFGRLTVIAEADPKIKPSGRQKRTVACRCSCGKEKVVPLGNLFKKKHATKSCGCYSLEMARTRKVHGHTRAPGRTPEYRVWSSVVQRCTRESDLMYRKGIGLCDKWKDFKSFIEDVGARPKPYLHLRRLDQNVGYQPGNVAWMERGYRDFIHRSLLPEQPTFPIPPSQ